MSKETRRVPKLRFPGFTEDWEQRKFVDLFEYERPDAYIVKSDNYNDKFNMPVLTANKAFILGYTNEKNSYDKPSIIFDDFTLDRKYVDFPYMLKSSAIKILTSKSQHNLRFLFERLNATRFEVLGHARHYISVVQNTTTLCPSIEEAVCISNLLTKFDELLTLHQRKLDHLNMKKKALLQKLFPKNGERYPELRFSGFTDAWEQRKLIDIAKTFIGLVTTMTENYRDSGTLLIRNSDIKEGQFVFSENPIHLDEEFAEKNKTRRLQIGDVVTVHTGDIGTSAVIEEKEAGAIGFATINTRTDKSTLNPYFLATYFNTEKHKCYANSVSTGDGRSNYNIKDFNKLVISIPTLDEQERISVLINDINTIITLHQQEPFLCGNSVNGGVKLC